MPRVSTTNTLFKKASETRRYSMDFSNLLATGETIEDTTPAPNVQSIRLGGAVTDLSISGVTVEGQTVTMSIAGGTNTHKYKVIVTITTSASQILCGDGILSVRD